MGPVSREPPVDRLPESVTNAIRLRTLHEALEVSQPMKTVRELFLCTLLASLVAFTGLLALTVWDFDHTLTQIPDAVQTGNREVTANVTELEVAALKEAHAMRIEMEQRVDTLLGTILESEQDANRQLTEINVTIARAEQDLNAAAGTLVAAGTDLSEQGKGLRNDIAPSIAGLNLLMQRNALPAEILGTLGAAKVTAGETAQTMKDVRDALPAILTGVNEVVENSGKATAASAEAAQQTTNVMRNFAAASKPLPLPLRIFLQVAPPLAGFAAGAATTYSVVK